MFRVKNKNIYLNRGDTITLQLVNNEGQFEAGDKIKFYICEKEDYTNIVFQKEFIVAETSNFAEIKLTSDETRIGKLIKNNSLTYWYEIELNSEITLIGHDSDGPKKIIFYPEARKDYSIDPSEIEPDYQEASEEQISEMFN